MASLGSVIRHQRDTLGLSQEELAMRTKGQISQTYISALERGVACNITFGKLRALAYALELPVSTLLANTEQALEPGAAEAASTAA